MLAVLVFQAHLHMVHFFPCVLEGKYLSSGIANTAIILAIPGIEYRIDHNKIPIFGSATDYGILGSFWRPGFTPKKR